jgi:hypothetical protein
MSERIIFQVDTDIEFYKRIEKTARRAGESVSTWMVEAAKARLKDSGERRQSSSAARWSVIRGVFSLLVSLIKGLLG